MDDIPERVRYRVLACRGMKHYGILGPITSDLYWLADRNIIAGLKNRMYNIMYDQPLRERNFAAVCLSGQVVGEQRDGPV